MKRFLFSTVFVAVLAALVGAQGPSLKPSPLDRAKLLQRNKDLMKVTIDKGIVLAQEYDPLRRADTCTKLAGDWSTAIRAAASLKGDDGVHRVNELGQHFGQVIDRGVVANLAQARREIQSGTPAEKELFQKRDAALDVLKGLEDSLRGSREFEPVVQRLAADRSKLVQATKVEKR